MNGLDPRKGSRKLEEMPIEKIKSLIEIEPLLTLDPQAWLILDIDETLVTTEKFPGCEKWYEERVHHHKTLGTEAAVEKANAEWEEIHLKTAVVCVEKSIPFWLASFQKTRRTIAATARAPRFAKRTRAQLKEVGIEFSGSGETHELSNSASYQNGVLYVGPLGNKGSSLTELFLKIGKPASVVMVDDKLHHLEGAETKLNGVSVAFRGGHIHSSPWLNSRRIF